MKTFGEKDLPRRCLCLDGHLVLESLVIVLTLVSCLATTCVCLVDFEILSVLKDGDGNSPNATSIYIHANSSNRRSTKVAKEIDEDVMSCVRNVSLCVNRGIAALFVIEIILKLATLRKVFITKPHHVFDSIVVFAIAGFQAAFYALQIPRVYYYASYSILMRLWRICYVCNLRSRRIRQDLEHDLESRIEDHFKITQKCIALEGRLIKQEKRIKELKTEILISKSNETERVSTPKAKDAIKNRTPVENVPSNIHIAIAKKTNEDKAEEDLLNGNISPVSDNVFIHDKDYVDSSGATQHILTYKIQNATRNFKPRWRRSSTSEYLDLKLSSRAAEDTAKRSPTTYPKKSVSCSDLLEVDNNNSANEYNVSGIITQTTTYHCLTSDVEDSNNNNNKSSSNNINDNDDIDNHKLFLHRQNSCPEYMYTQRTSITNYESMLIEDYTLSNKFGFENGGFSQGDNAFAMMMLEEEHEENMTYRNQDGIPTTSL